MLLDPQRRFPVMCLTQDGTGISHSEQADRLCAAGARWIQLRMKNATPEIWMSEAVAAVDVCRRYDAILIVNDSVEIATASGADGVHLGGEDGDWAAARLALGPDGILGGTVNRLEEAARAVESGCLDYAGVGPLRFTSTKRVLAPLLGLEGVREIVAELRGIPAWVIGGVLPSDLPSLRELGAAGVAVSSSIHRNDRLEENLAEFLTAWDQAQTPSAASPPS
jgi:thiamine-phosphate pyrophosphorylase